MKKIISIIAIISLLVSVLAVNAVAAGADVQFSVTDAQGKPGDTVTVDVNVDKNVGVYGMRFWIKFDSRCFDLVSVTNGTVFTNSEYEAEAVVDDSGEYLYYAEGSSLTENVTNTGVIATLELKILKAAPNGDYEVTVYFGEKPGGFFFDCTNPDNERSVEMTKAGVITVSGSDSVTLPETEPVTEPVTDPVTDAVTTTVTPPNGYETEMVTEIVTDDKGEPVTDAEGETVVTEVPIAIPTTPGTQKPEDTTGEEPEPETELVYVTDAEGEQVTDDKGEPVTTYVTVENDASPINTVVLVICIAAAAIAVSLIVVVVVTSKKKQ